MTLEMKTMYVHCNQTSSRTLSSRIRSLVCLLVAMMTATATVGCGGGSASNDAAAPSGDSTSTTGGSDPDTTLAKILKTGVVRIAYANEAPFGYKDRETGEVTGEAPEIARELFKRMGVETIDATLTEFGQLIPGLKANRYDVVAAGMYVTPKRAEEIHFTNPTYSIGEAFLVAAGNPMNLHSFEDITANPDAKLGVVKGTVELTYARDLGIPSDQVVVFENNSFAVQGVKAGRADAFAGTAMTVQTLAEKHGGELERAAPFTQPDTGNGSVRNYGAFGVRKGDEALLARLNEELGKYIGSPEHIELIATFGFTEAELPGDITTEEIITGP